MRISKNAKTAIAALVASSTLMGCSTSDDTKVSKDKLGTLGLALTVEGFEVNEVNVVIESEDLDSQVSRSRDFDVSDPNATISATEYGLPAATYKVSLSANVVDDPETDFDESSVPCVGSADGIVVESGQTTEVNDLVLLCTQDGGQVQTAGGIRVNAQAEAEVLNQCPDLIGGAFVAPLHTSVGADVALTAEHATNVIVEWSASAGSISDDGTTYTCPTTPGIYTVQADFARDSECTQSFTEQVTCHSTYDANVETLPSAFAFTGSCSLGAPCQLEQDGNELSVTCGTRRLLTLTGGAITEDEFAFLNSGSECVGSVVDGEFVGSCADFAGETCDFATDSTPEPTPDCPVLSGVSDLTVCSGTYDSCEVSQDACNILAKCDDALLTGSVNADGSILLTDTHDSMTFSCSGDTCTQRGRGLQNPATCGHAATVTAVPSACEATLPSEGFALDGCGLDGLCFARQNGCAWEVACNNGVYNGLASATNDFAFEGPAGEDCSASIDENGEFVGACDGASTCEFAAADVAPADGCFDLADTIHVRGCGFGAPTPFYVLQDGCDFYGVAPSRGVAVSGATRENGMTFDGMSDGWVCSLDYDADVGALLGECLHDNGPDEEPSQCRNLSDQEARLKITWSE